MIYHIKTQIANKENIYIPVTLLAKIIDWHIDSSSEIMARGDKGKFSAHDLFIQKRLNTICYCHVRYES